MEFLLPLSATDRLNYSAGEGAFPRVRGATHYDFHHLAFCYRGLNIPVYHRDFLVSETIEDRCAEDVHIPASHSAQINIPLLLSHIRQNSYITLTATSTIQ